MTKTTAPSITVDGIEYLLLDEDDVDEEIHEPTVQDIVAELRNSLSFVISADRPGVLAAIEIIESNYL